MRILILTVGGSPQPIKTSIIKSAPQEIIFVCSDDSELVKGSYTEIANILKDTNQIDIPHEIIRIKHFDDFNDCFSESYKKLVQLRQKYPESEIIADFTGGTKSMTAGLAAASLDIQNIIMGIVKGDREDLIKVTNGTQTLHLSSFHRPLIERQKNLIKNYFQGYDYASAGKIIEDLMLIPDLPSDESATLQKWLTLSRALDSWDKFDHRIAWKKLAPYRKNYTQLVMFLEACISSRSYMDSNYIISSIDNLPLKEKGHGFELVEDLFLNAQRKAAQERYDDAVARLYRAIELLGQIRLKMAYGIDTGNVSLDKLPPSLQDKYRLMAQDKKLQLPLTKSFELLKELDDLLGQLYEERRHELRNFLIIRNASILAHQLTPVNQADYKKAQQFFKNFLEQSSIRLKWKIYAKPVQFTHIP